MRSKWRSLGVLTGVLFVAGLAARWVEDPAWVELRKRQPSLQLNSLTEALGQGVTVGLLGGFRAVVADFFWLRIEVYWEKYDLPATQTMIHMVSAIDPRPTYFWINGARMIAYDMPNWRIDALGGAFKVPESVQRHINEQQAEVGVEHLENGRSFHPDDPMLVIEQGNIWLIRLNDLERASKLYREACDMPGVPAYAPRIYGELLRRMGRLEDAYDWLKKLYPTLDPTSDFDEPDVILGRIRDLEKELKIPPALAYIPPEESGVKHEADLTAPPNLGQPELTPVPLKQPDSDAP